MGSASAMMGFESMSSGAGLALRGEMGRGAAGGFSGGAEHPVNANNPNRSMRLSIAEVSAI